MTVLQKCRCSGQLKAEGAVPEEILILLAFQDDFLQHNPFSRNGEDKRTIPSRRCGERWSPLEHV